MVWNGKDEKVDATPFNMGMFFYMNLNTNIQLKGHACINDDYVLQYKVMRVIFRDISFKLNKNEKIKFNKLFKKAKNTLKMIRTNDIYAISTVNILDELDMYITESMNKYGMIFPDIAIKGLKALDERYKINQEKKG